MMASGFAIGVTEGRILKVRPTDRLIDINVGAKNGFKKGQRICFRTEVDDRKFCGIVAKSRAHKSRVQIQQGNVALLASDMTVAVNKRNSQRQSQRFRKGGADNKDFFGFGLGVSPGGTIIGLDFISKAPATEDIGGYLRLVPKDEDEGQTGFTALGGYIRPTFSDDNFEFYAFAGAGIIQVDPVAGDTETVIGPTLGLGVNYVTQDLLRIGLEHGTYTSWSGDTKGTSLPVVLLKFHVQI